MRRLAGVVWLAGASAALATSATSALAAGGDTPAPELKPVAPLEWTDAFAVTAAPTSVHFIARYRDTQGAWHRLETWRQGDLRLHRRSDDRIDLFAVQATLAASGQIPTLAAGGEMQLRLFDHQRHIAAGVSRSNLYRIGMPTDAFGLAHLLAVPHGTYRVEPLEPAQVQAEWPAAVDAIAPCRWRALLRPNDRPARTLVCWSADWGLPLLIVAAGGEPALVLRVEAVDRAADPQFGDTLPPAPAGYATVDVNDEIDPGAD